jgi:hypothetical protein
MRRARGCGLFSSQRLPADATVPRGQPTPADHARAQAILERLELPSGCYEEYKRAALVFIDSAQVQSNFIRLGSAVAPIVRPRLKASLLFGRPYLVCDVPRNWIARVLPDCEAAAIQPLRRDWPPLVILPIPQPDRTRVEMQSIIEHEFVHIHQILLGRFQGSRPISTTFEGMRREFFRSIRNEYEANLVQLTRWPHLWRGTQWPLDAWCVLRGYTSALEGLIEACLEKQSSMRVFGALFDGLPTRVAKGLAGNRIPSAHALWVKQLWTRHFRTAIDVVTAHRVDMLFSPRHEALRELARLYEGVDAARRQPIRRGSGQPT